MKALIRKIKRFLLWIVVAFFASTILSVVALRWIPVYFTPLMFIRVYQQSKADQPLTLHHHWVPLDEISPSLPVAVIASEDARFMEHNGFDYKAIEHAAIRNLKHPEKRKLGASTISQQCSSGLAARGCARASKSISPPLSNCCGPRSASSRFISTPSRWARGYMVPMP